MNKPLPLSEQPELKKLPSLNMPSGLENFLSEIGGIARFMARFFRNVWFPPYEFNEVLRQSYTLGVKSLGLVGITGFIMGLVLTIQARPTMVEFGAESWIPSMVAYSVVLEIGPVITALICAGKIGSSIGAELGSMRVTEQIDAMEVSGTNPFKYIVITRVLATTIMIPLLVFYADAIAMLGSYIGINIKDDVSLRLYFSQAFTAIGFKDVIPATIKTVFFGFTIGIVGCYKGYNSDNGTEGVGRAANSAVVLGSLLVFILDMLAVQITALIYY
jgi:phospholipid/cholesterol/gamma-HCH transport system permease protein